MSLFIFWSMVALIAYTYLLFPLFIFLRGWLVRRPFKSSSITPTVSVVIAAYNEQRDIKARLENLLAQDYPRNKLEIIIASDGSSDGTNEIVRSYAAQGIKLLALPRQGKNATLKAGAAHATGQILVFSDANTEFARNAIRNLVRPFVDPTVGGVAGDQRYIKSQQVRSNNEGEEGYWNLDRLFKQAESRAGSVTSATGAIYAVRRALFRPIPPNTGAVDDFVISTDVIAQGYRLVFAADAVAYETVAKSSDLEFKRKIRVLKGGLRAVLVQRVLLNPFRYGFYAFQLFWHKVLRRLVVFPLLIMFLVSPLLWSRGLFYQLLTIAQLAFYGCALLGWLFRKNWLGHLKIFTLPFYFCMVYTAALLGAFGALRGQKIEHWETQR